MLDDGTLLQEYARTGSESAFAELVQRHLDLVYSTARRGVGGDEFLAKDVSQRVFLDLARKAAALSKRPVLTGWLYTSAWFAAAKAVRSERRRQAREQEVQAMQETSPSAPPDFDWEKLRPILDTAMLELRETDREALLLRFFERCSLAEVGRKLGLSENAARMRVERASERLRALLAQRGITSTAAALGLVLAHQAVLSAPAGLAAAVTAASVAGAAASSSYTTLSLLFMSKIKAVLIGTALVAGVGTPVALQYQANGRLKAEIETLRSQLAAQVPPPIDPRPGDTEELARIRGEHLELMRLRGEVAALRQSLAAVPKGTTSSDELDRNKAARRASEEIQGRALLAKSPDIPMIPANSWANAGATNPVAALQTLNWSVRNHNTNAFAGVLSWDPQAKARAEALFAALPQSVQQNYGSVDGVIFDMALNSGTPIAAYRVLSQTDQGPDDVSMVEQHIYVDGRVRENTVQFQRDENGNWHQVIPQELMPKLEIVLNNLNGMPSPGGK